MFCEHPICSLEATTICKYHCHLSVCEQHRLEHEKKLLTDFEAELNHLSQPIGTLLNQTRSNLKDLDQSHQDDLDQITSSYDSHVLAIEQRLKFLKTTSAFISSKREQLINYQNGDQQLTRADYQQIQNLIQQTQQNLHQQYHFNQQIREKNQMIKTYSMDVECIEISDTEDEQSENSIDITNNEEEVSVPQRKKMKIDKTRRYEVNSVYDYCPLTQLGVFGLKSTHNLPRLCSKTTNRQRYLYVHLSSYHRLKSTYANKITKAIHYGQDPMKTVIFPPDSTEIIVGDMQCPFDSTAAKFNEKNAIPNTPCTSAVFYHYFQTHLQRVHSISRTNAKLIYRAMKNSGTISHVQFEEDLCDAKKD